MLTNVPLTISFTKRRLNSEGTKHLCEIESLIKEFNVREKQIPMRLPDFKLVITGTQYGYKRDDGVFVIPIGCLNLKDRSLPASKTQKHCFIKEKTTNNK